MRSLAEFPYKATFEPGFAGRRGLAKHIKDHLVWQRPKGIRGGKMTVFPVPGEPVDKPTFPSIVTTSAWPPESPQFMLVQDSTYAESFDLQIQGTDEVMVSSVMLALRPILCPHVDSYGSLMIELPEYYGVQARFTPLGGKRLFLEQADDPDSRIRACNITIEMLIPTCKVVSVASGVTVKYASGEDGELIELT